MNPYLAMSAALASGSMELKINYHLILKQPKEMVTQIKKMVFFLKT